MLKKVMAMVASKYLDIKIRIRAIETRLMIQSLLLRDRKMLRHLFRQRKCFNLSNKVKDEDDDFESESIGALISNSFASTPVSVVQVAEERMEMEDDDEIVQVADDAEDDDEYMDLRHSPFEDEDPKEARSVSTMEMVKNVKEGQGKKFILENDIDQVADLFIQRFHHQMRLQRSNSESSFAHCPL